ncbi:phosphate ABC transporter permease PstA [Pseudonocardia sp. KRD-184]|uniref:Phosphate transport system permease protein PstA n=1 Tax=Pseudonocardia oceani TaxID=2792013 RepID=A0ABS6U9H0_9PSEU|nr:phosphate ABC transporter permease PstA [Pseudonocardia oceani]MBW0090684.1 phosphate ABC transporter permease PstA [Pseudonocardia oceani]MBW0097836.1 phosphate ABC transporter permease PstA [Pseudonocardia oceani]MBW0110435.1 phosphate ABC transporter permease PstA [Pseudonocardia oceani]MBW0121514.1 phosphate ABC transporter permease PstA [Pseudonocardia oceani]MBW0128519.1 phosphate ABC transporter permease PstA [Pseudonocardia oceani]
MTTSTTKTSGSQSTLQAPQGPSPRATGSLPPRAQWIVLGVVVAVAILLRLTFGTNLALLAVGAAVANVVVIHLWARVVEGSRAAADRTVTAVVGSAFAIAMVPLASLLFTVVTLGTNRFDVQFFTNSMLGVVGEGGGAYHAIMGTLIVTGLAALISVPIGVMTAVYLVEYGKGRLARSITFFVDVMTGIPSIVAGLFAVALFQLFFGPGIRLGIMGAVALSVLMIPVVVRSVEEMLKIVPNELREASYALGVSKWRTIVKVVLRTSVAGIATGITLAIARVIGETAPLLITLGATTGVNLNPFDGRMASLPVFSYYSYTQPGVPPQPGLDRAWAAAFVLMLIVMVLSLLARLISRLFSPKIR